MGEYLGGPYDGEPAPPPRDPAKLLRSFTLCEGDGYRYRYRFVIETGNWLFVGVELERRDGGDRRGG